MTALLSALAALACAAGTPSEVAVRIDTYDRQPISRFIYGMNFPEAAQTWGARVPRGVTLSRFGGNRLSAYNWENNASSCGNDCGEAYPNDGFLGGGSTPGEAVRSRAAWAFAHGAGFLAPVPMLGWVAADKDGPVPLRLPLAERRLRFKKSRPRKGGPLADAPNPRDEAVYQDEYVSWLERTFPAARRDPARPIFYALDNEPDLWGSTHEEARGNRLGPGKFVLTGYDELVKLSIEHASAVKDVAPGALVFGPVLSTWNGFANLYHNDAPDPAGRQFFLEYYLTALRKAGEAQGRRLIDVLDVHWYPEATSTRFQAVSNEWAEQDAPMVTARVQAPRSLWDPGYRERSWVADAAGGAIRLIPRLKEMISARYPGTKLAFTEYYYGRGGDISGALAQADVLGIFGREGVFAATLWPQGAVWAYKGDLDRTYACVFASFRAYRDYDGQGSAFGDVSLRTTVSNPDPASAYASADPGDASRLVLVAINKTDAPTTAAVTVASSLAFRRAEVWRVSGEVGRCEGPVRVGPDLPIAQNAVRIALPPLSVSTVVLRP